MLFCQRLDLLVIYFAGIVVQAILHGIKQLAGKINLGAVRQMTTVGKAHSQNSVVRLQQGKIYCRVGLRP